MWIYLVFFNYLYISFSMRKFCFQVMISYCNGKSTIISIHSVDSLLFYTKQMKHYPSLWCPHLLNSLQLLYYSDSGWWWQIIERIVTITANSPSQDYPQTTWSKESRMTVNRLVWVKLPLFLLTDHVIWMLF